MLDGDAQSNWRDTNYDSDYRDVYPKTAEGKRLNLKPGSELHQKIAGYIRDNGKIMWSYGEPVRAATRAIRNNMDCVVPKRTREQTMAKSANPDKPFDVMVPLTRAIMEHGTAFAMSEFTSPYGNYELEGEGPDGMYQAAVNEIVLNAQAEWFSHDQQFINFFRAAFMSPVAAMVPVWSKHKAKNTVDVEVDSLLREMIEETVPDAMRGEMLNLLEEQTLHEGNRLESIDPMLLLTHPQSKTGDIDSQQRATCDGYVMRGNAFDIIEREVDPEEHLMNGKYLADLCESGKGRTSWLGNDIFSDESGRSDNYNLAEPSGADHNLASDFFSGIRLWCWIRPSKLDLGKSDKPELWVMTLAADEVLIECRPVSTWSGMKEMIRASLTNDGHYALPTSVLQMVHGIQEYLNWKVRAHVQSETASLNGILFTHQNIFDDVEELINRKQLGGVVWTRPPKWGEQSNLANNFFQPNISSPDPNWASAINIFMGFYNQIAGVSQIMEGDMSNLPERPGVAGVSIANDNSADRMGLYMKTLRSQWFKPLVYLLGKNTDQYLDRQSHYNIIGTRLEKELQYEFGSSVTAIPVSPRDIKKNKNNWRVSTQSHRQKAQTIQAYQLVLERLIQDPEMAARMVPDPPRFLNYIMREMGAKNMYVFREHGVNAQVVPDEEIMSMRDRGQAVPLSQMQEESR